MQENVAHLELLRNNLEASVSAKEQVIREKQVEVEEAEKKLLIATSKAEEVSKNNLRLKGNLEVRVAEVAKLKEEVKPSWTSPGWVTWQLGMLSPVLSHKYRNLGPQSRWLA